MKVNTDMGLVPQPEPQTLSQLESTQETPEPQTPTQLESTQETPEPQTPTQLESTQETPEPQTPTQLESTQETPEPQTPTQLESTQETPEPQTLSQLESTQETPEPQPGPVPLAHIELRIQALENRRQLLLRQQQFHKKGNIDGTINEVSGDDSDKTSELETIQKELEVLLGERRCRLQNEGGSVQLIDDSQNQQVTSLNHFHLKPRGGVYILPPLHAATQEKGPLDTVPVDSLGQTADVVKCPFCQEIVLTETCKKSGELVWTIFCMCAMIGCVAGCCLIPFFMNRLKNVQHRCPHCKALVHTYKPF